MRKTLLWAALAWVAVTLPMALLLWLTGPERLGVVGFWVAALPVVSMAALVVIWYLGALVFYLFWQYLELIQIVTKIPLGRWMGSRLASDTFLRNARLTSPYGWLHRKAVAAYPFIPRATKDA